MSDLKRKFYYTFHSGKNPKFIYYLVNFVRQAVPKPLLNAMLDHELRKLDSRPDKEYILSRVDYYCRLTAETPYDREAFLKASTELRHTKKPVHPSTITMRWSSPVGSTSPCAGFFRLAI